jgi:peptide deformylase
MTIRTVLRMGEPLLLQQAQAVTEFDTPALHALIQDLEDTMQAMNGAGIAAPQIGESVQVVIFGQKTPDGAANPRYPDADQVPYTILINPVLTPVGTDMEDGWEGCLSVPGLRGEVPRYRRLHYTGFDQYGKPIDRLVSGFHARVVQHECDHLNGILYPMRIKDMKKFGFTDIIFAGRDIQDD